MARPNRALARRLAHALAARVVGERIDKLWRTGPRSLLLKIRGLPGGDEGDGPAPRLLIDLAVGHPRVAVTRRWPAPQAAPDRHALIFRAHVEGARIVAVASDDRALTLDLMGRGGPTRLTLQLAGRYPNAALFDRDGAELIRLVDGIPAVDPDSPPLPDGDDPWADLDDDAFLVAYGRVSDADARRREVASRLAGLRRDLEASRRKAARAVRAIEADLARVDEAADDRHRGELLKTVLGRVPRGASSIAVADWSRGGAETLVPLDPAVDALTNMERYFKRYRKYASARDTVEERLLEALDRAAACERHLEAASALALRVEVDDPELIDVELDAARDAATPLLPRAPLGPSAPSRSSPDEPALPYRRFTAADGTAILVGKGSTDNDRLTFQVARGNDLWLHARDAPGSHVIIRPSGAGPIAHETLVDAALLAAWHCRLRGDGAIDVMYTERKHVRKPRGGAPGRVTTAATRNLTVREDPERLERLYGTTGSP